ncbi:MAG: helix-turn-helix domain-containing protein [bacterium]
MEHERAAEIGGRLRHLRLRCRMSIRQLAERAGVAASYVSGVESAKISPTIATLRKMLLVLGTDLGAFFTADAQIPTGNVFRREEMQSAADAGRNYAFILPRRADIGIGMVDEELIPGEVPEFETLESDLAGYVLNGELTLKIADEEAQLLRTGDAFYVSAGKPVRGYCAGDTPAHLVTVTTPAKY